MADNNKIIEEGKYAPRNYEDTFALSADKLDELSSLIRRDLSEGESDKHDWVQETVTNNNAYFGIKKKVDWPFKGASKISSQITRVMVDTTKANILASVRAPNEIIATTFNKSQSAENAKYVQDIHNALADKEYKLVEVSDKGIHGSLVESFTVLKPIYRYDVMETVQTITRWLPEQYNTEGLQYDSTTGNITDAEGNIIPSLSELPEDTTGLHECKLEITTEHVKEGVHILTLPGSNVYIPISSPGETPFEKYQRAPYVIEDDYKTVQEMRIMQEQKKIKNFDIVVGELPGVLQQELQTVKEEQAGVFNFTQNHERHLCRNIWWNGKFEYKGKLRELQVYFNVETSTIMKVIVSPFGMRPYFPLVPFPVDGTPFGEAMPKQIRELVKELELAINTVINMGLIKAYPPKFFDPTGGMDPKLLGAFGPNSYIPVRDPQRNIFMPPQPEDPRILMEMIQFIRDLIERVTANSDTVQGQSAPTNSTKFEIEQKLVRAGVRFDMIFNRLKAQMQPMFPYIHMLLLRFMPLEKEVELMGEDRAVVKGPDGQPMSRLQAIYMQEGMHGIGLKGNSIIEEQTKLNQAMQLAEIAAKPPYMQYISFKPESPYYILFNILQHLNPVFQEKILATPDEVATLMRDRAKVQQEQEQQAIEEGKQQGPPPELIKMQMEMQMKQAELQLAAQKQEADMKLEAEKKQQEMAMKEQEHSQKLRHMEEAHRIKLENMKEESNAKAKAAAKAKPDNSKS